MEENNATEVQKLKNIYELDFDKLNDPKWREESESFWKEMEKISTEMSDDDPRMVPGYHQYGLDAHTKDVIRAKGMLKAKDNLAEMMACIQALLRQK